MHKDSRVAKRYASALFDVALRDGAIETVANDLLLIERFVKEIPYLRAVIVQPLVSDVRKTKIIGEAFESRICATSLNFLYLLVAKRRENLIDECILEYQKLVEAHSQHVTAFVASAVELSREQVEALTNALAHRTGKNITLKSQVDSTMLGGVRVRIGDMVIDGGLRTRLQRIKQQLLAQT